MNEDPVAPRLKAGVIGPWGLAALVFLAALIITLPTVLSYASLSRHAPSAGAAAAWLWTTVNPTTGLVAGVVLQSTLIAWVCLRGAEASIKTTIRLMLIETGVVLAMC
jgi:amino acid transporter